MLNKVFITGDTHGKVEERLGEIIMEEHCPEPEKTALIILGDAGLNFYLNKSERKRKKEMFTNGIRVYCVRGNHEERPENLGFKLINDPDVGNMVYIDSENPDLRYFVDGGHYTILGYSVLVIGGAYSVDKYYRLQSIPHPEAKWTGWFESEQLTDGEMDLIKQGVQGCHFDFVLSHTCPYSWIPVDLFIKGIDQNTVDNTMEYWLDEIKDTFDWGVWCFGHYHKDRFERPKVQQFSKYIETMSSVWHRWFGNQTYKYEYYLQTAPGYFDDLSKEEALKWTPGCAYRE